MKQRGDEFSDLADLSRLLEAIGTRLHAKNRIGGGESNFLWFLAETIRKAGRLADMETRNPETLKSFGDGSQTGSVQYEQLEDLFFQLLRAQKTDL